MSLIPEHFEYVKEIVKHSKGWGAGIKLSIKILGLGEFSIERQPRETNRTLKKAVYKKPD